MPSAKKPRVNPRRKKRPRSRGNGDGSIYWSDSYNRFVAQVTIGRDADGRSRRKKFFGPRGDRSRAARLGVEERARPYLGRRRRSTESLQSYVDRWISHAPVRSSTQDYYRTAARHLGRLGAMTLPFIEPIDIRSHLETLNVGARMVRAVYSLLHRVLREAAQLELISRNPAANVSPPKMPKREMRALTAPEVGILLETVRGDRLEALVVLALTSTMGPAELLALRWRDVHLDEGYLLVAGDLVANAGTGYRPTIEPTKTARRRRRIDLPKVAVDALRARQERAESQEFVFTTSTGKLIRPSALRWYWWRPLVKKAHERESSFPEGLRLYDLRHTANAIMSFTGVPIELARDRMGHASIKTTVDVYGHLYLGASRVVAEKLDEFFERFDDVPPQALPHGRSTGNNTEVKKRR